MMRGVGLGLLWVSLLFGGACHRSPPPSASTRPVTIALLNRFDTTLHAPFSNNLISTQPLYALIYNRLYTLSPGQPPASDIIARSETAGRRITFTLRPGLRFSDGRPLTASDVVASVQNCFRLATQPPPLYKLVVGGSEWRAGQGTACAGLHVLGPDRFGVDLLQEEEDFALYFASIALVVLPADQGLWSRSYSGPFAVESLRQEPERAVLALRRNPHYAGARPGVERLVLYFYDRPAPFKQAVARHEPDLFFNFLDYSFPPPPAEYEVQRTPMLGGFYLLLNPARPPFSNAELRRQLLHQIDFFADEQVRGWPLSSPATHILPYGFEETSLFPPLTRVEPAPPPKQRIRAISVDFTRGIRQQFLPILARELAHLGIDLTTSWVEYEEWVARKKRGDFDISCFYFMLDLPQPRHFYEMVFTDGLELNPGMEIADAKALLERCRIEPDPRRRLELLAQLEEIARREAFLIPVFNSLAQMGKKHGTPPARLDSMLRLIFPGERS